MEEVTGVLKTKFNKNPSRDHGGQQVAQQRPFRRREHRSRGVIRRCRKMLPSSVIYCSVSFFLAEINQDELILQQQRRIEKEVNIPLVSCVFQKCFFFFEKLKSKHSSYSLRINLALFEGLFRFM